MTVEFFPKGVCSQYMRVNAEDGIIKDVQVLGGCSGNLQAVMRLLTGMEISDAIERLSGINCNGRGTSCPDQLSIALRQLQGSSSSKNAAKPALNADASQPERSEFFPMKATLEGSCRENE